MGLEIKEQLTHSFGTKILSYGDQAGDFWIQIMPENLYGVIDFLRSSPSLLFDSFVDLCGVDYLPRKPRFEVVIHLMSQSLLHRIRIRVLVPDETLTVPTLTKFWAGANWQEREAYDMYGIIFDGHPKLERILSAPDVTDFPQRKDYPLLGSRQKKDEL